MGGCVRRRRACMSFLSSSWLLFRSGIKVVTPAASLLCCSAGVRIAAAGRQRDVMATGGAGGGDADVVSKIGKNLIQNFRTKEVSFSPWKTLTLSPSLPLSYPLPLFSLSLKYLLMEAECAVGFAMGGQYCSYHVSATFRMTVVSAGRC